MIDKATLARASLPLLALAAFGLSLYPQMVPIAALQPAEAEAPLEREAGAPASDRVGQDSLAAAEDPLAIPGEQEPYQPCLEPSLCGANSPPLAESDRKTLMTGVLLPSGPHTEDARARGRIHSAVLMALTRTGFAPAESSRHHFLLFLGSARITSRRQCRRRRRPGYSCSCQQGPGGASFHMNDSNGTLHLAIANK